MPDDDRLRRLKSFQKDVDSQAKILAEASAHPNYTVDVPHAGAIKRIFDDFLVEFPSSIPQFDFHGDPSYVRSQISKARSDVQGMIDAHERGAEEEAKRYELRLSVDAARSLLKDRIEEGETIANNPEYALRYGDSAGDWSRRTSETLNGMFSSRLNAQDFMKHLRPKNLLELQLMQGEPGIYVRSGVEFLRFIDEQLYILQQPANKVEALVGRPNPVRDVTKVFVVHGHDGEVREAVARFIEKLGLEPLILHERPNKGRTIITKSVRSRPLLALQSF